MKFQLFIEVFLDSGGKNFAGEGLEDDLKAGSLNTDFINQQQEMNKKVAIEYQISF